jgi:hypothetical protein
VYSNKGIDSRITGSAVRIDEAEGQHQISGGPDGRHQPMIPVSSVSETNPLVTGGGSRWNRIAKRGAGILARNGVDWVVGNFFRVEHLQTDGPGARRRKAVDDCCKIPSGPGPPAFAANAVVIDGNKDDGPAAWYRPHNGKAIKHHRFQPTERFPFAPAGRGHAEGKHQKKCRVGSSKRFHFSQRFKNRKKPNAPVRPESFGEIRIPGQPGCLFQDPWRSVTAFGQVWR